MIGFHNYGSLDVALTLCKAAQILPEVKHFMEDVGEIV